MGLRRATDCTEVIFRVFILHSGNGKQGTCDRSVIRCTFLLSMHEIRDAVNKFLYNHE